MFAFLGELHYLERVPVQTPMRESYGRFRRIVAFGFLWCFINVFSMSCGVDLPGRSHLAGGMRNLFDLSGKERLDPKITIGACLVRLLIMPIVILSAAKFLPIAVALKQVLLVQAAMPAAVTPIILARHYGGSPGVAVQMVLATSALALITIPIWISWGVQFVF